MFNKIEINNNGELLVNLDLVCLDYNDKPELIKMFAGYRSELSDEFYEAYRNLINMYDKKSDNLQIEFLKAMNFYKSAIMEAKPASLKNLVLYILDNLPDLNIKINRLLYDIEQMIRQGGKQYFTNDQREIIIIGNDLIKTNDYKNRFKYFVSANFDPNYQFINLNKKEVN